MKSCICCKKNFPLSDFYVHKQMGDGHLNKCKACVRKYARSRGGLNSVREYNRNRPNAKERSRKNCARESAKYASDPDYRSMKARKLREYRRKHKDKSAAHAVIRRGLKNGKVVAKEFCERCNCDGKLHAHHEDYSKPLDVMWLCTSCHGKRHKELNEIIRSEE